MNTTTLYSVSSDAISVLNQGNLGLSQTQDELDSSVNDMQKHIATLPSDKRSLEKKCRDLKAKNIALSNQVENLELAQTFIKKCADGYKARNQEFHDAIQHLEAKNKDSLNTIQRLESENKKLKSDYERLVREAMTKESQQAKGISSYSDLTILNRPASKDLPQTRLSGNPVWVLTRGI